MYATLPMSIITANNPNRREWYFPDGTIVPRPRDSPNGDFIRTGWTHEVCLNRRNDAMTPLGTYECRVPHMDNTSTEVLGPRNS